MQRLCVPRPERHYGIREGALYDLLPPSERRKDPLIYFCEDFARLRSRSLDHARELCRWTDGLVDAVGLEEKPEERRLRIAACLMSDIGWRINPDFRAEQSLSVIAHSAMSGIDHPGRAFLALTVYLRHAGPNVPFERLPARFRSLIGLINDDRRAVKRARILSAAIRTAHMMSMGHAGIIDETRFLVEKNRLAFVIPTVHAELNGYRLRRRFEALARLLGFEPVVRVDR